MYILNVLEDYGSAFVYLHIADKKDYYESYWYGIS